MGHPHEVVTQTGRIPRIMQIAAESVGFRVEAVQSTQRGKPQIALPILKDLYYDVVAQTGRIIGIVLVPCKMAGRAIERTHALTRCTDPEQARSCVQTDGPSLSVAEAEGVVRITPISKKAATGPIETAQSPGASHP